MIKAVLFDYGGVLSDAGRRGSIHRVSAELFGTDVDLNKLDELHSKYRRGLISTDEFFEEFSQTHKSERKLSKEDWIAASQDIFTRSNPVYELVDSLRAHNIKTGMLSNMYEMTADHLREIGNYGGFDPLILSYEVKLAKPDPAIFELSIERLGVEPNEILFIDDQDKNIPPAEDLGMHTVLAVSPEQIVADTKALIKEQNGLDL